VRALLVLVALTLWGTQVQADPPGLGLLQGAARAGLERQLGVSSLDELPVIEIDQALDDASGTFSARMVLTFTNRTGAPLAVLPLILGPNTGHELGAAADQSGSLTVSEVATVEGPPARFATPRPSLVEVRFGSPIPDRGRVRVAVRYAGRLRRLAQDANDVFAQAMSSIGALSGGGASDYGLLAVGDGIITVASAYPMIAPFREGRFDTSAPARFGDPTYGGVAAFRVRTVVPEGVGVVTNLVDRAPTAVPGVGRLVVSEGALVRDVVLVAGRDLARRSVRVGRTTVTSVYRQRDAAAGGRVLEAAAAALGSLERRFGPYPYTELDVVEASLVGGAGGVEFTGLVLVAGMLYRSPADSQSPLASMLRMMNGLGGMLGAATAGAGAAPPEARMADMLGDTLEFTVAHEVAHQWFAGLVGNDSRRFPSLDEPLAQWAAALCFADRRGAAAGRAAMDANVKMNYALYRLLGGADRAVLRDTTSFQSGVEYAGLVYGKAPYLYAALGQSLGQARIEAAVRGAVARHRFRIVSTQEWAATLEAEAGGPASGVRRAFRRWLEETHGDADLGVDDSGDLVLSTLFPPDVAASLRESLPALGMQPRDLLRMLFGGGLGGAAPVGPGLDPEAALRALGGLEGVLPTP